MTVTPTNAPNRDELRWQEVVIRCVECGEPGLVCTDEGATCTECGTGYPVVDGIPVLLESSLRNANGDQAPRLTEAAVHLDLRAQVAVANRDVYDAMGLARYADIHHHDASHQSRQANDGLLDDIRSRMPTAVRVVDLGAGDCRLAAAATRLFPEVVAVDLSVRMLRESRGEGGDAVVRICAAADNTPPAPNSVDVVTATALLHHIADLSRFLREAYRILRPGGVLFTTHDPNRRLVRAHEKVRKWLRRPPGGWFGGTTGELAEFQTAQYGGICPQELSEALRDAGFNSVKVRGHVTPAQLSSALDRSSRWLLRCANTAAPTLAATHLQATAEKSRA